MTSMQTPDDLIAPPVSDREKLLRKIDRRDKAVKLFEFVILTAVVGLTLFALLRINLIVANNERNTEEQRISQQRNTKAALAEVDKRAKANQARNDIELCIVSVSPTIRTPEYVSGCYDQIEKQLDLKVQRFGDGVE